MFDEEIHLRDYLHVIIKWRWIIAAVFVVITLSATFKVLRQSPVYQATARIIIEKKNPGIAPFNESYLWDSWDGEYLQSQYKIITSRALAKQVIQKLDMRGKLPDEAEAESGKKSFSLRRYISQLTELLGLQKPPPLSESAVALMQEEQMVGGFLGMVSVNPVRESRLVDVSATSTDREEAAYIANIWVETYIEQNLEAQSAASKDAVRWLIEEVENIRGKLTESEAVLQKYREQHAVISFEDRQNIVMQKLSSLSDAVDNARINRISLEAQYQKIQSYQAAKLETLPGVMASGTIQHLKVDLVRLQSQLSELGKKFRAKHPEIIALRSQIEVIQKQITSEIAHVTDSLKQQYEVALAQEQELVEALEEQKNDALEMNQKAITYGILEKEVDSNQWVYDALLQKVKELSIAERLETNNIRIVDRAIIPNYPIAPRRKRNVMLAMIVGFVLGTSLAFFLEYLDNSFKVPEDVTQFLDIPFLGFIPKMSIKHLVPAEYKYLAETIVKAAPKSIVAETYRSLRTTVTFSAPSESSSSPQSGLALLVTSSEASEGKSCTVANLGIAMAQSGKKTLVIDCDFRKPVMHQIFNVNNTNGFADLLAEINRNGIDHKKQGRIKRTEILNLDLIPCGKIPPNPSELLSSEFTGIAVDFLRRKYDMILLDSPPVNMVTDSVILSRIANGVVLIVRAGMTKREFVKRSTEQLHQADANILGGVLNYVDIQKNKYYYYYAYHYPQYYRKENDMIGLEGKKKFPAFGLGKFM